MVKNRTSTFGDLRVTVLALAAFLFVAPGAFAMEWGNGNTSSTMPDRLQEATTKDAAVYGAIPVDARRNAKINDQEVVVRESLANDVGFAVSETGGGYVWLPAPVKPQTAGYTDARELKLKVRELASQLIARMDPSLRGVVALPTTFVNQEDFSRSSPLGRFMAEQLIYEFNQRGFPVREYRMAPSIQSREGEGELLLTRKIAPISAKTKNVVFVVGTYFIDPQAVFVNARLVRGGGEVLRTAQLVLPNSAMIRRMLAGSGITLKKGSIAIQDFKITTQPTNLTPIDRGSDIH